MSHVHDLDGLGPHAGEGEDSGQGGHPAGPAAPDLRRQAARGRPHPERLQHPEVSTGLSTISVWWHVDF